jgi:hypothetical protein
MNASVAGVINGLSMLLSDCSTIVNSKHHVGHTAGFLEESTLHIKSLKEKQPWRLTAVF